MFYIINIAVYIIWAIYLLRREKMDFHRFIEMYSLSIICIDPPEFILFKVLDFYSFQPKLLANPIKDSLLGLMFSDGFILPLAAIILYCYVKPNRIWRYAFIFSGLHIALELLYLRFGYLKYNNWSIWYSSAAYLSGYTTAVYLFLLLKRKSTPFWLRLAIFAYPAFGWFGIVFNGLLDFNRFELDFFKNEEVSNDIIHIGVVWGIVLLHAIFVSHLKPLLREYVYILTALSVSIFFIWLCSKGMLFYSHWNNILIILRWSTSFALLFLYGNWELKYYGKQKSVY